MVALECESIFMVWRKRTCAAVPPGRIGAGCKTPTVLCSNKLGKQEERKKNRKSERGREGNFPKDTLMQ